MGALTKAEIVGEVSEKFELDKQVSVNIVELFFELIRQSLEENCQVKLSGFGNFDLRDKCSRPGRNPRTGEEVSIAPRRVVTFRGGQKLRTSIENAIHKSTITT